MTARARRKRETLGDRLVHNLDNVIGVVGPDDSGRPSTKDVAEILTQLREGITSFDQQADIVPFTR
jgi:hypothetical protein